MAKTKKELEEELNWLAAQEAEMRFREEEKLKAAKERYANPDRQFLRDTESKRRYEQGLSEIDAIGEEKFAQEKAKAADMESFKKELESGATEMELLKQDLKDVGEDFKTGYKLTKKGAEKLASSSAYQRFGERTNLQRIDPLKGLVKRQGVRTGKRGRPRKYAPVVPSGRPRGRPTSNDLSIGGKRFYSDAGVMPMQRKPYVPPTREQARLLQLFGNKQQFWGYGGNPVEINQRITSGQGIIKNGDGGATGRMFGIFRR